jgi:hypothetical protein
MLDDFERGYLSAAALAWDTIEKRDDTIKSVAPKRKKSVARHGWEIIILPNLPCEKQAEALQHKAALEFFYANLTVANAIDANEKGGFKLLVRQMMDAVGKRYSVHEIIWKLEYTTPPPSQQPDHLQPDNLQLPTSFPSSTSVHGPAPSPQPNPQSSPACSSQPETLQPDNFEPSANLQPLPSSLLPLLPSVQSSSLKTNPQSAIPNPQFILPQSDNFEPDNPQPLPPIPRLTAELRHVPLWFFENTTGALRYLPASDSLHPSLSGANFLNTAASIPLAPGSWMVTVGEGLMHACSIAWMTKALPLQDWLDFSSRYGHPALIASTTAERNSQDWLELEKMLGVFLDQLSAVTNAAVGEQIKLLDLKGGGDLPYERLISRMDRLITALWRGADLSTLSREQGYGASLQSGESDILEQDDAELISETLQAHIDRYVIQYLFGPQAKPLAAVKILVTPKQSTIQDLQIDQFLIAHGARLAINDTLARYGRAEANPNEPALQSPSLSPMKNDR